MTPSQKIEEYAQKAEQILLDAIQRFCIKKKCDAYLNDMVYDSYFARTKETDTETIEFVIEAPKSLLEIMKTYEDIFDRLPNKSFIDGEWY